MRAPGTSKSTAADVYRTLRARGLAPRFADEVPRYAMRKACAAAIGREDRASETRRAGEEPSPRDQDATHACLDSVTPVPDDDPVDTSSRASSTSPAPRFRVPKHQRYVPPVQRLRATSTGPTRAFADKIVRIAVDPVARAALRERVRDSCGVRTRIDRRKKDEPSRRAKKNQPAEKKTNPRMTRRRAPSRSNRTRLPRRLPCPRMSRATPRTRTSRVTPDDHRPVRHATKKNEAREERRRKGIRRSPFAAGGARRRRRRSPRSRRATPSFRGAGGRVTSRARNAKPRENNAWRSSPTPWFACSARRGRGF